MYIYGVSHVLHVRNCHVLQIPSSKMLLCSSINILRLPTFVSPHTASRLCLWCKHHNCHILGEFGFQGKHQPLVFTRRWCYHQSSIFSQLFTLQIHQGQHFYPFTMLMVLRERVTCSFANLSCISFYCNLLTLRILKIQSVCVWCSLFNFTTRLSQSKVIL